METATTPADRRGVPPGARAPSLADALAPIVALVVLLGLSYCLFGDRASAGFCFFNLINPLATVGFAFLGLRMLRPPSGGTVAVGPEAGQPAAG